MLKDINDILKSRWSRGGRLDVFKYLRNAGRYCTGVSGQFGRGLLTYPHCSRVSPQAWLFQT